MSINVQSADDAQQQQTPFAVAKEPPDSIIGQLRRRTAEQQKIRVKAFPVGGDYGDMLQIRYKPLKPDELDDFLVIQEEATQARAIEMNMDMMSKACVDVIGVDQDTKEITRLDDPQGNPIRLDNRLAVILDMPNPDPDIPLTAREVITLLFGSNGMAIGVHGDEVTKWMQAGGKGES